MFFSLERTVLLDAVSKLQRVVGNKTSMPVLEGILITAEDNKITLITNNLEMGMKKELSANCEKNGSIVINARILGDILRRMNGVSVTFETDEKLNCHIKSGEAIFDIVGMAADDFPEIPSVVNEETVSIDAQILSDMIKSTVFAAATNEGIKPVLTGINFSVEDSVLQLVAIDGYRLAIRREKVDKIKNFEFTVSCKSVLEILKLIDEKSEKVNLRFSKNLISFEIDGFSFVCRLFEGEFVNYKKTLPASFTQRVVVSTKELIDTIERVSLLINESFSTPVRCYFNELNVVFSCATTAGRSTETFETKLDGEKFEIGLNSKYLLDSLRAVSTEKIQILFNGPNAGILILPLEGEDFKYMIMPMRLK